MKHIAFFIICLFFFYGNTFAAPKKNYVSENKLKGKVKSITERTYKAVGYFDDAKKLELLSYSHILINIGGDLLQEEKYKADSTLESKEIREYHRKGYITASFRYKSNEILESKSTYKCDIKGNPVEENSYSDKDILLEKTIYKYDLKGNEIEITRYNSVGILQGKIKYEYDVYGNISKNAIYNSKTEVSNEFFHKDGNTLTSHYISMALEEQSENKYDIKGNIIESTITTIRPSDWPTFSSTYKYEYDKKGNWLRNVYSNFGIPKEVTERVIEYYK